MHPFRRAACLVLLSAGAATAAAAQTSDPHAGHAAAPPGAHTGHASAAMQTPQPAMPGMMPGMSMGGGDMGGMMMSGMQPPAPKPPPPGPVLRLDASAAASADPVQGSPAQITLAFDRPVTLRELVLTNAVGQQTPLHTSLPETPVESFTFPVTIPLPAGDYHLAWEAAEPGPIRRGRLAFAVLQAEGSAAPAAPTAHHHH